MIVLIVQFFSTLLFFFYLRSKHSIYSVCQTIYKVFISSVPAIGYSYSDFFRLHRFFFFPFPPPQSNSFFHVIIFSYIHLGILSRVISGFRREVDENCTLLGYYASNRANFLLTFRDNLLVPS